MFYTIPESYPELTLIFSLIFLLSSLMEILFAFFNWRELESWGWLLAFGFFTGLLGVLLYTHPQRTASIITVLTGCGLLFRSVMVISISLELKHYGELAWGKLLTLGILSAGFSFLLMLNPDFNGFTIVTWTGLAMITLGICAIYFSLIVRKLHDISSGIPIDLKLKFYQIQRQIQEELTAE
jgi:uncharacterized membrane protein HdeD (DUF308 family)